MNQLVIRRFYRFIKLILISSSLSGCLATPYFHPESVSLCKVDNSGVWDAKSTRLSLRRADVLYFFNVSDYGSHNAEHFGTNGTYWIMIDGSTFGSQAGYRAPPMIYDPKDAVLEINGKQIYSMPAIWQAIQESDPKSALRGNFLPKIEMRAPLNLNEKAVPFPRWYFLGFKLSAPSPQDTYRFLPGSIELDGVKTELPIFQSCYKPAESGWYPIH